MLLLYGNLFLTFMTELPDNGLNTVFFNFSFFYYRSGGLIHTLFVYLFFFGQYEHSCRHSFITFAVAQLHIFTAAVGGTSMGCRAEIWTRACPTATHAAHYHLSYAASRFLIHGKGVTSQRCFSMAMTNFLKNGLNTCTPACPDPGWHRRRLWALCRWAGSAEVGSLSRGNSPHLLVLNMGTFSTIV